MKLPSPKNKTKDLSEYVIIKNNGLNGARYYVPPLWLIDTATGTGTGPGPGPVQETGPITTFTKSEKA